MKDSRATVSANVSLSPKGSHVFLIALLLIGATALLVGFYFLWHRLGTAWIPILVGLLCLAASFIGWIRSQHQLDLDAPSETSISSRQTGIELVTDSRALSSQQSIQGLADLFSMIGHRHPLPTPDGLVDTRGNPVPNSRADADARVAQANNEAQSILKDAASTLSGSSQDNLEEQAPELHHTADHGGQ